MKAVILNHERGGTVVLDRDGLFRFVTGYTSEPIGTGIELRKQPPISIKMIASIAAGFIVALTLGIFAMLWTSADHYIYMDTDQSVELQFNIFGSLKAAVPLSDNGTELLDGLVLNGGAADIVASLINAANEKGYLDAASDLPNVLITVITRGESPPEQLISSIGATLAEQGIGNLTVIEASSMDLRDRATEMGVSPGLLNLAEIIAFGDDNPVPLEELLRTPWNQLYITIYKEEGADGQEYRGENEDVGLNDPQPSSTDDSAGNRGNDSQDAGAQNTSQPPTDPPSTDAPPPSYPPPSSPALTDPPSTDAPPPTDPPPSSPAPTDPPPSSPAPTDPPPSGPAPTDPPPTNPAPTDPPPPSPAPTDPPPSSPAPTDPPPPSPAPVTPGSGNNNARATAAMGGTGNARNVTIAVTDASGTYTQTFDFENGTRKGTYIIRGSDGNYTVNIEFQGNDVRKIEISKYESRG